MAKKTSKKKINNPTVEEINADGIRPKTIDAAYSDLVGVFQKYKLTTREILLVYGNLGYTLGASIGGYEKGPSEKELKAMYYEKAPSVDVALMLQGLLVTTWTDDLTKTLEDLKKDN